MAKAAYSRCRRLLSYIDWSDEIDKYLHHYPRRHVGLDCQALV
nr:MAG TPA: hypothetical protein [Caudoviricetes sp.]